MNILLGRRLGMRPQEGGEEGGGEDDDEESDYFVGRGRSRQKKNPRKAKHARKDAKIFLSLSFFLRVCVCM